MIKTQVHYSFDEIQEEVRQLVYQGRVSRQQLLYTVCEFLPCCEWRYIEGELEKNDFLLRDHIIDLLGKENWSDD
jgi:hypothetical protein